MEAEHNLKLIPYPKTKPIKIKKFGIKIVPELKAESDFERFESTGKIYTPVYNYLKLGNKKQTVVLIAEEVCKNLSTFIVNLSTTGYAVYKKELLKKFYNIFYPHIISLDKKSSYDNKDDTKKFKKYLKLIKDYLDEKLC